MELQLYQKIFDHIKSPVIISYPESLIECNRAFLGLLKANTSNEVQQYSPLRKIVEEILVEGISTQYKSIEDLKGNTQFLEVSLSTLSEIDDIHLLEFKAVDDQSLYEEITFISAHNRELFNNSPDAIVILDSNGNVVDMNEAFIWLFGYTRLETIGRNIDTLVVPELQQQQAKELFQRVLGQERVEVTLQRQTKDRRILDVHVVAYPVIIDKRISGNYIIYQDITQVKKTEKLLHEKEEFLQQLFNRSLFPTVILDEEETVLDTNSKFEELFGYTRDESVGKHINTLVLPEGFESEAHKFKTVILENRTMMAKTKRKHKDGSLMDVEAVGSPVLIGGKVHGFFAMYRDIRVEEESLKDLTVLLNTDPLTGLYSRKFIYDLIEQRLAASKENQEGTFALIYIDLDQFKQVNDTYGHETGDHLLIAVAKRLQQPFNSKTFVSRIGGDEFLILVDDISSHEMEKLMDELKNILSEPCTINGNLLSTVASLGLSYYPDHGKTTDELISVADAHMYDEKKYKQIQRNPVRIDPVL
jgi:Amt family ammonium transporter